LASKENTYDVIIIGAGAAGLMCAIEAGKRGRKTLVIDKSKKAGPKILISGGGRCNFTNLYVEPEAYLSENPHFVKSALSRYTQWDFIHLLDEHNITWHEKTLGQLFCDQKAGAIVDMLIDECRTQGVQILMQEDVEAIKKADLHYVLSTERENYLTAHLVIATGGPSIPRMGSTDFGYRIARQFGLRVIPPRPALVPMTFDPGSPDYPFQGLSGVSLEVITQCDNHQFREQMLITHKGLSGPAILQISSYWRKGMPLVINLLPDIDVARWLPEQQETRPRTELRTLLSEVIPRRLALRLCESQLPDRPVIELGKKQIVEIAHQLNSMTLQPSGTEGYRTAEVTAGGVDTSELSSKTLESRKQPGLFFIGEVVDVTGWLGGYNFQWAWSSGWCAGQYV
jgi:predicted Rossmann fold flavoprotein